MSSFKKTMLASLGEPTVKKAKKDIKFYVAGEEVLTKREEKEYDQKIADSSPLVKSILNTLNSPEDTIQRLGFEIDPLHLDKYSNLYVRVPPHLQQPFTLKMTPLRNDLVAAIINTRASHLSSFGRPQPDRFSTGFKIEPEPGYTEHLQNDEKKKLQDRIAEVERKFLTCGDTNGYKDHEVMSLSQFLWMQGRNAALFSRFATEMIFKDTANGEKFHSFRPLDVGTIYFATPQKEANAQIRRQAKRLLENLKNKKFKAERFVDDEYVYVQVINGKPQQAFTEEECYVKNLTATSDIENMGYPVTPIDTIVSAVTTYVNITTHNRLYFQNGRASKGIVVVQSDDIQESIMEGVKRHFTANINSVANSHRTPIFGIGKDDTITWTPIDQAGKDAEFQFLSDTTARVTLSAYQMSPDELPGWNHLSKGSNSQSLSESNNEYKLLAARDVGMRPFLAHFQAFLNEQILPLLAPDLAKMCSIKLVGLDAETAEKESQRLAAEQGVHLTYDEIMERTEKQPLGKKNGGRFPLNPAQQQVMSSYMTFGEILEEFFDKKDASKDPALAFYQNDMWFKWQDMQMQMQQMQAQAGQPPEGQAEGGAPADPNSPTGAAIDQALGALSKGEKSLTPLRRNLLQQQKATIRNVLSEFDLESKELAKQIVDLAKLHT